MTTAERLTEANMNRDSYARLIARQVCRGEAPNPHYVYEFGRWETIADGLISLMSR